MNIKLLKKIRKRFEIVYYPNGYVTNNGYTEYEWFKWKGCVMLNDKDE